MTSAIFPDLTVPEAATVAAGDVFDKVDSASASDNPDGDLTHGATALLRSALTWRITATHFILLDVLW